MIGFSFFLFPFIFVVRSTPYYGDCSWTTDSLELLLSFDENFDDEFGKAISPTVVTSSPYRNIVTPGNFPFFHSVDFDGVDDLLEIDSSGLSFYDSTITVSIWLKVSEFSETTTSVDFVITKDDYLVDTGDRRDWMMALWQVTPDTGRIRVANRIGSQFYFSDDESLIGKNEWIHVAFSHNGQNLIGGLTLFVNGAVRTLSDNVIIKSDMVNSEPVRVGGQCAGCRNFDGEVSCIHVYSRQLNSSEILSLYNDGCKCFSRSCGGMFHTNESVCSDHGNCSSRNNCECDEGYYGENCESYPLLCYGEFFNSSTLCSGNGTCTDLNECSCFSGYVGRECGSWGCFDFPRNDSRVCTGFGNCTSWNGCECEEFYFGEECQITKCGDFSWSNGSSEDFICSGNGVCELKNRSCVCGLGYGGLDCEVFSCDGFFPTDSELVCNNHGNCVAFDECDCVDDVLYDNQTFCSYRCFGIRSTNTKEVCSGHGECVDHNNCSCMFEGSYSGESCNYWSCWGKSVLEVDSICGGHGICVDEDFCICFQGYQTNDSQIYGRNCDQWKCDHVDRLDENGVCNQRGQCIASDQCTCEDGYEGENCETWSCGYYDKGEKERTCSGHGECLRPGVCECDAGFASDDCGQNLMYFTVMTPILSSAALVLLFGLCMFCFCVFCSGVFCIVLLILLVIGCAGVSSVNRIQNKRLNKFSGLRDVDLLLKEQELEDDDKVAHLKIDKNLFEIEFDEIVVENVIGEGGSQSIVFKANWKKIVVAFKCFKTRNICETQETFSDFEKEVMILASLSHPHIIQFYGATLKPPRVGIVMEFCSQGDLSDFLRDFLQSSAGIKYPLREKCRMVVEIISAMLYLHSKKIIHRDLKLENVLVDVHYKTKLMDFGLSKVVDRMSQMKTKLVGTSVYMAPELVLHGNYDELCDIFSFGILVYILFTENRNPYGNTLDEKGSIEFKVANNPNYRPDISELEKELTDEFKWITRIVTISWKSNPKERMGFEEMSELFSAGNWENKDDDEPHRDSKNEGNDDDSTKKDQRNDLVSVEKYNDMQSKLNKKISKLKKRIIHLEEELLKD